MKVLLFALVLTTLIIPLSRAHTVVTVSGQTISQADGFRFKRTPLTTSRLYKEFGVSRRDYVLVLDENGGLNFLMFYPRADSNLPPIVLLKAPAEDRRQTIFHEWPKSGIAQGLGESPIFHPTTNAPGNLFTEFRGTAFGGIRNRYYPDVKILGGLFEVRGSTLTNFFKFNMKLHRTHLPPLNATAPDSTAENKRPAR